jgi:hypothetical protein
MLSIPNAVDIEPIAGGVLEFKLKRMEADATCFCHLPDRVRQLTNSECLVPHRITMHKLEDYADVEKPPAEFPAPFLKMLIGSINEVFLFECTLSQSTPTSVGPFVSQ